MGPTGTQGIRGYTGEQGEPGEDATPGMASSGSLYWTTYTPSWASTGTTPTIGNGSITGKWIRINPFTVLWKIKLTWGSTTNGGTGVWLFGAPVTAIDTSAYSEPGGAVLNDSSSGQHIGQVIKFNATSVYVQTDVAPNGITAISDFTWAVNDTLLTQSIWEA